jgi:hypothetical protein
MRTTSRPTRALTALALAAVVAGGAVRLTAGGADTASAANEADYAVIGAEPEQPLPRSGPERAVVEFYRSVIHGQYRRAHELSFEPVWRGGGRPVPVGLQSSDGFVRAMDDEIGPGGMRVGVARFAVGKPRVLTGNAGELVALDEAGVPKTDVVSVPVSGQLVGMCEISKFAHRAVAAKVDGSWRVLLPGRKQPNEPHFEKWFN